MPLTPRPLAPLALRLVEIPGIPRVRGVQAVGLARLPTLIRGGASPLRRAAEQHPAQHRDLLRQLRDPGIGLRERLLGPLGTLTPVRHISGVTGHRREGHVLQNTPSPSNTPRTAPGVSRTKPQPRRRPRLQTHAALTPHVTTGGHSDSARPPTGSPNTYLDSIVAYQGQFLPADISIDTAMLEEQIAGLMRQIGIPIPDQTYLLDVSPELCAERFARREGRPLTDFELAQITQIRASFLALARSNSRIMVVDASDALESVVDLISEDLRWRLEGRRRDHPGNGLLLPRPPLRWANSEQSSATGASRQRLESGGVVQALLIELRVTTAIS